MAEVDIPWALAQLQHFIGLTTPRRDVAGFPAGPFGAEPDILLLQDVVEAILNKLYPQWRDENSVSVNDEWYQHRTACQRCIGRIDRQAEVDEKLGGRTSGPALRADQLHPWVWDAARAHWESGNHREAVDAAARNVNSRLQRKVDRRDLSEWKLAHDAFRLEPPEQGKPRLRLMPPDGSETYTSLHQGVASFAAGCYRAIRNPVAHLADDEIDLPEQEALEQLAAFSLLARWIDDALLDEVQ